jgi:hypothetical protein
MELEGDANITKVNSQYRETERKWPMGYCLSCWINSPLKLHDYKVYNYVS